MKSRNFAETEKGSANFRVDDRGEVESEKGVEMNGVLIGLERIFGFVERKCWLRSGYLSSWSGIDDCGAVFQVRGAKTMLAERFIELLERNIKHPAQL